MSKVRKKMSEAQRTMQRCQREMKRAQFLLDLEEVVEKFVSDPFNDKIPESIYHSSDDGFSCYFKDRPEPKEEVEETEETEPEGEDKSGV